MKRQWKCCQPFLPFFPSFFTTQSIGIGRHWWEILTKWPETEDLVFAHPCLDFASVCTVFPFFPFFFVDPVYRQMPCAPDKDFFWEWEQCCSNPKHHLRQTYSLPLLPRERFSSSPLQEGGEKRETGEDSLEGGERERLVGTSRMLKFRLGSASPLWSH